jgi:hypothetical protein
MSALGLQQRHLAELAEQAQHLVLGRRVFGLRVEHGAPHLVHRALAVAAADELVGRFVDAVLPPGGCVREHEPALPAPLLALHPHLRTQARPGACHAVPLRTEE